MKKNKISRSLLLPDPLRLELFRRSPELGPNMLFFSGGSAIRGLSQSLTRYTHNAIHLITTFDSGGSSAALRRAFAMPAVGDIRSRIMALADNTVRGNHAIVELFSFRLPIIDDFDVKSNCELLEIVSLLASGKHPLMMQVAEPMRRIIRTHLELFLQSMPLGFSLSNASIGNLVLTAGYLAYGRELEPVIYIFSKLVRALGLVMPISNIPVHLAVRLQNGELIIQQHNFTGKNSSCIKSPIADFWFCKSSENTEPLEIRLAPRVGELIRSSCLICYPMGSFYSSLLANILPKGVGRAIAANPNPKVYIPNVLDDPEELGLTIEDKIKILLTHLQRDCAKDTPVSALLNYVILDKTQKILLSELAISNFAKQGIEIIDCSLISPQSRPLFDNALLADILSSFC